ncbi:MAG: efflux RND transporter periplasmic adaptor subunit [Crocinitomicaceae bacterium]|nr:efflux RND transporter periplasmic adaptor subunit [Crocinitomicaceae bacterium]
MTEKRARNKKIRNIIIWSVVGLLVMLFIYSVFIKIPKSYVDVQLEPILTEILYTEVSATGTINPMETVTVGTQVSGEITDVYVDYNDKVKKGQLLARLDTRNLRSSLDESRANVEKSEIMVEQTKRSLDREKELYEKGISSDLSLEQAQDAYNNAVASLKIAKIQLNKMSVNLGYAEIISPIDGIVISKDIEVGQTVAATFATPTLFSIVHDLSMMKIEASVDEADIGKVKKGQHVVFTVDAYPDDEFTGVVEQIQIQPVILQNVVTYKTIVYVNNPDLKLLPGMTATLIIQTEAQPSDRTVPNSALTFEPLEYDWSILKKKGYSMKKSELAKDQESIWVMRNKVFTQIPVEVTFTNGIRSAVKGEVSLEDSVITNCKIQIGEKKSGGLFSGGEEDE